MESAPSIVQQLTRLLQSQPMFKLLRTMTGLEMADVPLSDDDDDSDDDDQGNKVITVMQILEMSSEMIDNFWVNMKQLFKNLPALP